MRFLLRHLQSHRVDSAIIYGLAVLSVLVLSNIEKPIIHIPQVEQAKTVAHQKDSIVPVVRENTFLNVKIKGKAYVLYDIVEKKVIAGKNIDMQLPLASISKVMMTITARTHNSGTKMITINPESIEDDYDLGLKNGQVWKLDELLKYTLVFSSNDGAQAIADGLGGRKFFVSEMNTDAANFGLDLYFSHPAGVDIGSTIGGLGSALSVAKLVAIAHQKFPEIFDVTTKRRVTVTSSTGKIIGIPNTNQEVVNFSGLEMSKTGFTDKAGGNLVVIVDVSIGHPVAIVVLGSTHESRFSDMEILYEALQKNFQ